MSAQNVALLRMAGRLVDVSGKSGQAHFEEQIRGAWGTAMADIPRHLAADSGLAERFATQLATAASRPQHATLLFAMIDDGGKDTIVGEYFQNAEVEQLAQLGASNADILRLFGRVSGADGEENIEDRGLHAPLIEFGLASVAVPSGPPAAGSAVVTSTHVFPGAAEGPDSPGMLRDLVRIHEALTRQGTRKPLERPGQPEIQLWLASEPNSKARVAEAPVAAPKPAPEAAKPEPKVENKAVEAKTAEPKVTATKVAETKAPEAKVADAKPVEVKPAESKPSQTKASEAKIPMPEPGATPKPVAAVSAPVEKPTPTSVVAKPVAKEAAPAEKAAPKSAPKPLVVPPTLLEEPSGGSNKMVFIGGGIAAAIALGVGGYFLYSGSSKPSTPAAAPVAVQPSQPISDPASLKPAPTVPAKGGSTSGPTTSAPSSTVDAASTTTPKAPAVTPAAAAPAAATPTTPAQSTPPAAAANTGERRAAALDALGLGAKEDKKRDALKALTGQ